LRAPATDRGEPSDASRFPRGVSSEDWGDWRWHLRNAIRTREALEAYIVVSETERAAIEATSARYRWQITPYYAALMDPSDDNCPIRLQAIPALAEMEEDGTSTTDPVDELVYRRTNRITHKYPDRVILNLTRVCPVYCRHCTRKYHTTHRQGTYFAGRESDDLRDDIAYVAADPRIRDVLVTGGDPLSYPDDRLCEVVGALRAIPHVEIIRIGTRFPVLLPQRITPKLCEMLERFHPIWVSTHFNHPKEITAEAAQACDRLLRHGIPVQNQSVLLKRVNDNAETMRQLVHGLIRIRVRPYYLYHCDRVSGVSHFVTSVETGRDIMRSLWGWTTGFAVPRYIITTPVGKVSLEEAQSSQAGDGYDLHGWGGTNYRYRETFD
jgi:lysine 2,3-aminomutase